MASVAMGWRTEAGRRGANEDAVLAERLPDGRELVAVADGMGGHRAGEIASRRALEALRAAVLAGESLRGAVGIANAAVFAAAREAPDREGMGTTLVALLRSGARYEVANVGDSRAYAISGADVRQITADHSFVAEAVAAGMSAEEAQRSRWRNALTRSIGTEREVEVDLFGPYDATEPHVVVLCSDGLHGSVSSHRLRGHLRDGSDPGDVAGRLAEAAYRNGSTDNISVAVVRFGVERRALAGTGSPRGRPVILMAPRRASTWVSRLRRVLGGLSARSA